jgi:hypothetical protein
MALSRVAPSLTPDYDRMTYECSKCGHSLVKEVRYRQPPARLEKTSS